MVNVPFVIYTDLKMMICKVEMVRRGKTRSKRRHVPILVGTLTCVKIGQSLVAHPFCTQAQTA